MMNYSSLLRLAKFALLAATLLSYCSSLPAMHLHRHNSTMIMDGSSTMMDMHDDETTTRAVMMSETSFAATEISVTSESAASAGSAVEETEEPHTERSPSTSRDHLEDILRAHYFGRHSHGSEELSCFFALREFYHLGPLSTNSFVDYEPSLQQISSDRRRCNRMVNKLNPPRHAQDFCHWTYTCNYDPNRFPSMIPNATQCTAAHGARCVQRLIEVTTFSRTFNNGQATWQKNNRPLLAVYGYTCRDEHY